jgi:hypothetical protein
MVDYKDAKILPAALPEIGASSGNAKMSGVKGSSSGAASKKKKAGDMAGSEDGAGPEKKKARPAAPKKPKAASKDASEDARKLAIQEIWGMGAGDAGAGGGGDGDDPSKKSKKAPKKRGSAPRKKGDFKSNSAEKLKEWQPVYGEGEVGKQSK